MELSKNWYVGAIIIILIVAVLSGYVYFTSEEKSSYTEYHFELKMESDSQAQVFWPIPYDPHNRGGDNMSELVNDLEIREGNGKITINETKHGKALIVTFDGSIKIKSHKRLYEDTNEYENEWSQYFFEDLSMRNKTEKTDDSHFVYSSSNNLKIVNFNCYYENVGELDSDRIVGRETKDIVLEKGWQSVEL